MKKTLAFHGKPIGRSGNLNSTELANLHSGKDDWRTPKDLFNALDAEYHFTLDPCSTHENALCEKHYTQAEDGLIQNWGGRSYL